MSTSIPTRSLEGFLSNARLFSTQKMDVIPVALIETGQKQSQVERQLNLSQCTVRCACQRYSETGGYTR